MARKHSAKKPSFFKVLIGDFSQRLHIPPSFIKNFNGRSLHKCLLRGPSRRLWNVELEKRENGLYFTQGWQVFAKDQFLEVGDFLVFSYNRESKFKVKIYDRSACEKDVEVAERRRGSPFPLEDEENQAEVNDEVIDIVTDSENCREDSENKATIDNRRSGNAMSGNNSSTDSEKETSSECISFKSKNRYFIETHNNYQLSNVTIPRKISTDEDLSSVKERDVMVRDETGISWPVKLKNRRKSPNYRVDMTAGWKECCRGNKISVGDTLVFEFVVQSLIQLHIYRAVGGKSCFVVLDAPL